MKNRRFLAAALVTAFAMGALTGCGGSTSTDSKGQVYFLNGKPEQEEALKKIAQDYTKETGVKVKIATAASGTYEQTLKSEISKKDAPTLIWVNGPVGLATWQKYTADLTDTEFAKALKDPNLALKGTDGKVYGVPFAVEGYGIIYNQAIMKKYFALPDAKVTDMKSIVNFAKLKEVVEDMQAKKAKLGIDGVFASTSLAPGEDWRWQTHLSNVPVYYEYQADKVNDKKKLDFKFNNEFKNIFDLYLNNSTIDKKLTTSKDVAASMAEFALGKAAMVQNGNWAWGQIEKISGNTVKAEDIKMLPIYTGHAGEETQGLCVGTEAFMAVNAKASKADQKATLDFVSWLFLKDGKKYVVKDLGFIAPFKNYTEADVPADPIAKEVAASMSNTNVKVVPWVFQTYPSQKFKDQFGQAIGQYASGNIDWNAVVKAVVDGWAAEKK